MAGITRKKPVKKGTPTDYQRQKGLETWYGLAFDYMGHDMSLEVLGPVAVNKLKSAGIVQKERESDQYENESVYESPAVSHVKAISEVIERKPIGNNREILEHSEIHKHDWLPYTEEEGLSCPEPGFIEWVNSFSEAGFSNAIPYRKFELYKQQAKRWIDANDSIYDCQNEDEEDIFIENEVARIGDNVSYGIRKYGKLKEAKVAGGFRWFGHSYYEVQDAICYIMDCGYSPIIPKCRQIGISSVFGYIVTFKTALQLNYFSKFLTYDEKKTEELFRDKIKFAYSEFPDIFRPKENPNWANNKITFSASKEKGRTESGLRQILCEVATPSAINGGSPNLVLVDEAAFVKCLTEMVDEAESAMYWTNPKTGKRELVRQMAMWGTGGKMINDTFEDMYRLSVEVWKSGNIEGAFLPLFIDFYSNPANTKKLYDELKHKAYRKKGPKANTSRIIFHAACPITLDDVFLKSSETLIDMGVINNNLLRIGEFAKKYPKGMPVGGRFKAIMDYNSPNTPESLFTHKLIGVEWEDMEETIAESDTDRSDISVMYPPAYRMREEPDKDWIYRYFQGTDSINSAEGHSNFSSAIWDSVLCAPVALLDFRESDFRECYRQAILMNIYYGNPHHLVEYNSAEEFINKIDALGQSQTLIMNAELNPRYRINGAKVGISSKANSKPFIIDSMKTMFIEHSQRFFFRLPFEQLKHFIQKTGKDGRKTTWAASDTTRFKDDSLYAITYSKIAADCYSQMGLVPHNLKQSSETEVNRRSLKRDSNGRLYWENINKFTPNNKNNNGRFEINTTPAGPPTAVPGESGFSRRT